MTAPSFARVKRHSLLNKKSTTCSASQLYSYPTSSTTFDASSGPIKFTWDTNCTVGSTVDLTLYAPSLSSPLIKKFKGIAFSDGSYSTTLLPKWWNSSTSIDLYVTLSDSSLPTFLANSPQGPPFVVTYPAASLTVAATGTNTGSTVAAAADTSKPDAVVVEVGAAKSGHGLTPGKLAAAILIPILALIVGIAFYVRYARKKQSIKRQRWSQAIDNRMSVISSSWIPGAGSTHRPSGQFPRDSTYRTSSVFAAEGNMAGMGVRNFGVEEPQMSENGNGRPILGIHHTAGESLPELATVRASVFSAGEDARKSRISFAGLEAGQRASRVSFGDNVRPTNLSSPNLLSGRRPASAYSSSQKSAPRKSFASECEMSPDMSISPQQSQGPFVLGEIAAPARRSVDESLRHLEAVNHANNDQEEEVLAETHQRPRLVSHHSSFSASSTLSKQINLAPPPSIVTSVEPSTLIAGSNLTTTTGYSPDDMLKAYAAKRAGHGGGRTPTFEVSQAEGGLGAGATVTSRLSVASARPQSMLSQNGEPGEKNPFRRSMLSDGSRYSHHSASGGQDHAHTQ